MFCVNQYIEINCGCWFLSNQIAKNLALSLLESKRFILSNARTESVIEKR